MPNEEEEELYSRYLTSNSEEHENISHALLGWTLGPFRSAGCSPSGQPPPQGSRTVSQEGSFGGDPPTIQANSHWFPGFLWNCWAWLWPRPKERPAYLAIIRLITYPIYNAYPNGAMEETIFVEQKSSTKTPSFMILEINGTTIRTKSPMVSLMSDQSNNVR